MKVEDISFFDYMKRTAAPKSGLPGSYLRVLENMIPLLRPKLKAWGWNENVYMLDSEQVGKLYQYVSEQIKLKESGVFGIYANTRTFQKNFYTAAIGKLKQFRAACEDGSILALFGDVETLQPVSAEPKPTETAAKKLLEHVSAVLRAEGFSYPGHLLENFYLSLKSKPFVILAGISGTGKTRLVRHFAEAVGATVENGQYVMIPVRPDWSDSSDLFGHSDLSGRFVPKALLEVVKRATENPDLPYFVCLDEMNLARVEYYLSDILSVIETRELTDTKTIVSDVLVPASYYGSDGQARARYGELRYPANLYLIGTVNMDETTFPFSKKVLDRANTIEFSFVDLVPSEAPSAGEVPPSERVANSVFQSDFLRLNQCDDFADEVEQWCSELEDINAILKQTNAQVGYRVRDEIVFYLLNNLNAEHLIDEDEAMDNEILQKILPRIQGNTQAVHNMLVELFKKCISDYKGIQPDSATLVSDMEQRLEEPHRYPKCARKIVQMIARYEADGFTSFWL